MFDPKKTITDLINTAYMDGSQFACTVFPSNPTPDDLEWRERMRDAHCNGMLHALSKVPHFNLDSIGPGVLASGFSGFEDSWRHMETPMEDLQAISEAGNDMVASMEQDRSINTALFVSPNERWPAPQFDGSNSEQEGLAVEFALESVRNPLSPSRLLEMAKALYQAETRSGGC